GGRRVLLAFPTRRSSDLGGRLVINEFSTPPSPLFRGFYRFYNAKVLPRVARVVGTNPDAYEYLNESIQDWPDQKRLSAWIREARSEEHTSELQSRENLVC